MKKKLIAIGSVMFWLIVWQAAAMIFDNKILLTTPVSVAVRLSELILEKDFINGIAYSSARILGGFLIGLTAGIVLAALSGKFAAVRQLFAPLVSAVKSVPVASFTILALIWVSSRNLSLLITSLIAIPIVYANILEGIDNLKPELDEMARIFEIPAGRRFVGIYLSQLLPYFRSASRLAMGLCWKSGIAAEVIGIPDGSIGEKLFMSKVYLETDDLFAWTIVIILMSWLCEKIFILIVDFAAGMVENM